MQPLEFAATGLSLIGLWLCILKSPWSFIVWLGSNLMWATWGVREGAWGLVATQIIFAAFGVYGFAKWRRQAADVRRLPRTR